MPRNSEGISTNPPPPRAHWRVNICFVILCMKNRSKPPREICKKRIPPSSPDPTKRSSHLDTRGGGGRLYPKSWLNTPRSTRWDNETAHRPRSWHPRGCVSGLPAEAHAPRLATTRGGTAVGGGGTVVATEGWEAIEEGFPSSTRSDESPSHLKSIPRENSFRAPSSDAALDLLVFHIGGGQLQSSKAGVLFPST